MKFRIASPVTSFSLGKSQLKQWLPISLILLLATGLYCYKLDAKSLWIDELISIGDAKVFGISRNFSKGRLLYYAMLRVWMWFGNSDAWLRGLAVLFGLASVFLIYKLGSCLFNKTTGLVAALLLTLSPVFINHAQEVRYYTLSICLGLAGTVVVTKALERQNFLFTQLLWPILRFLAIITTPLNATLVVSDLAIIGWKFRHRRSKLWSFGKGFLFLCFLCVLPSLSVARSQDSHKLILPLPGVTDVLRELRFFTAYPFPPSPPYATMFFQVYILLVVGVLAFAVFAKPRSPQLVWTCIWAFVPIASIFTFCYLFYSVWTTRYLLLACPYILILLAVGFLKLWQRWRIVAIALLATYAIALSMGLTQYYASSDRYVGKTGNYRALVEIINVQERPGDIIVWSSIHTRPSLVLDHYYRGSAPIYYQKRIPAEVQEQKEQAERWLENLPPTKSRLWLVYPAEQKQSDLLQTVLTEKYQVQLKEIIGNTKIFLLDPP